MSKEKAFRDWLEKYPNHKYSDGTISSYISALKNAPQWFKVNLNSPILEIDSVENLQRSLRVIQSVEDYDAINTKHSHGNFSAAISAYQKYLNSQFDFTWIDFYSELANVLLNFKDDRKALIEKIVKVYDGLDMKLPKLETTGTPIDIDPFTVFGLFNKGITESNRIKIVEAIANEFSVKVPVPIYFTGVPVLNNLKATFYWFQGDRGEHDIDNLWDVFESAISYANEQKPENRRRFIQAFDTVLPQGGIRWNITMGLFWIRPYTFLSLDSRNRWFISDPKNLSENFANSLPKLDVVPTGSEYITICENCSATMDKNDLPFSNYPELSAFAWTVSEEVNDFQKNGCGNDEEPDTESSGNAAVGDQNVQTIHYWMYSPGHGASKWDSFYSNGIMAIGWSSIGDLTQFASKEAMKQAMKQNYDATKSYKNDALATWQFANVIKPGDIVFVKRGLHTIIGRGVVCSDYRFDDTIEDDYKNLRNVRWTHKGEWDNPNQSVLKALTDISQYTEYVEKLCSLFTDEEAEEPEEAEVTYPPYSEDDFLSDVYMDQKDYQTLVAVLKNKKNIILQGAPGVGKTFAAKRLAYSIMGEKNPERVQMVQFHQSYSYEDFIEGYRPASKNTDGSDFIIKKGSFYKFCKKAADDDENDYFFIIDEINRGNLSKIFGELFMLIETDKRGLELQLLYSDEKFSVPKNVYLIGMMNTADRSLAMLDYALRRRFSFIDMKPGFETDGFLAYQEELGNEKFNSLISCVKQLNIHIAEDSSLGEGFCIGHSYFCNLSATSINDQTLNAIVEFELIPLLKEYWYDEAEKVNEWKVKLRSAIK